MSVIRRHFASPAMLVACAALIVALGGVSYAAAVLPENSVGTAQLQKKAVTRAKLKRNVVTSAKVKNGSLLAADFKTGQLPAGPQGAKGDAGSQGPTGPRGPAGQQGEPATKLFAAIRRDGSLVHGRGVTASTSPFAGYYKVTFDRPLDGCVATTGYWNEQTNGGPNPMNHFSLSRTPSPNEIAVQVYNSDLDKLFEVPFSLVVFC